MTFQSDAATEALTAIAKLLKRPDWSGSDHAAALRLTLTAGLESPEPHLRCLAVTALAAVRTEPADLAAAIAMRIDLEDDPDVLAAALRLLDNAVPAGLADPILAAAAPSLTELVDPEHDPDLSDLRNVWVVAHLNIALETDAPHATETVRTWFSRPVQAWPLFGTAVAALRGAFSFHSAGGPARTKAFDLVKSSAAALESDLTARPNDARVVRAADALIDQLYFASGAFDDSNSEPRPTDDQRAAWFRDAIPILEDLTLTRHPHSCYQLLQTLEFLIDEDPLRVFRAIAATIKGDSDFRFEQLGMEVAVRIIDRYVAEHRQLFLTNPDALSELRRILEVFATEGWSAALHLSYALGDIFR